MQMWISARLALALRCAVGKWFLPSGSRRFFPRRACRFKVKYLKVDFIALKRHVEKPFGPSHAGTQWIDGGWFSFQHIRARVTNRNPSSVRGETGSAIQRAKAVSVWFFSLRYPIFRFPSEPPLLHSLYCITRSVGFRFYPVKWIIPLQISLEFLEKLVRLISSRTF